MPHRIFLASLLSVLFLLALCLRSLADASPLSGGLFLGHELWTYKASIPAACCCASLAVCLWGLGAGLLGQGKLCHGCIICALPMLICCTFIADEACLPFLQQGHHTAELLQHSGIILMGLLLNIAGGWGIKTLWQGLLARSISPWKAGLSSLLLVAGSIINIPIWSACMAHYYPVWDLGLACWVGYISFIIIINCLIMLYLWSKKSR